MPYAPIDPDHGYQRSWRATDVVAQTDYWLRTTLRIRGAVIVGVNEFHVMFVEFDDMAHAVTIGREFRLAPFMRLADSAHGTFAESVRVAFDVRRIAAFLISLPG